MRRESCLKGNLDKSCAERYIITGEYFGEKYAILTIKENQLSKLKGYGVSKERVKLLKEIAKNIDSQMSDFNAVDDEIKSIQESFKKELIMLNKDYKVILSKEEIENILGRLIGERRKYHISISLSDTKITGVSFIRNLQLNPDEEDYKKYFYSFEGALYNDIDGYRRYGVFYGRHEVKYSLNLDRNKFGVAELKKVLTDCNKVFIGDVLTPARERYSI